MEGRSKLGQKKNMGASTGHAQKRKPTGYSQTGANPDDGFSAELAAFAGGGGDEVDYDEDSEGIRKIKVIVSQNTCVVFNICFLAA